jgi:hypothetical protein
VDWDHPLSAHLLKASQPGVNVVPAWQITQQDTKSHGIFQTLTGTLPCSRKHLQASFVRKPRFGYLHISLTEWTASPIKTTFPFVQQVGELVDVTLQSDILFALL